MTQTFLPISVTTSPICGCSWALETEKVMEVALDLHPRISGAISKNPVRSRLRDATFIGLIGNEQASEQVPHFAHQLCLSSIVRFRLAILQERVREFDAQGIVVTLILTMNIYDGIANFAVFSMECEALARTKESVH